MQRLDKENIEDIYALTPMQEGVLFHYLKTPGSLLYFEQICLDISGRLALKTFEKAWNFVIAANEMLRTIFRWQEVPNPIQIVLKTYKIKVRYFDFSDLDGTESKKVVQQVKINDKMETFDLQEIPYRITLCKRKENKYEMIFSNHHILFDGWSTIIILNEFFKVYEELCTGVPPVKPIKGKFIEFVRYLQNQDTMGQKKYWKEYLNAFDTKTDLPIKSRVSKKAMKVNTYQLRFFPTVKDQLENFVETYKMTVASFLYSAWGILLQKYNNIEDVVFGTTASGRSASLKGIENIVGLFINTLPLRIKSHHNEEILGLLYRVYNTLQEMEKYIDTPLVNIKEYSEINSGDELFDSIMVIENYPLRRLTRRNGRLSIDSFSVFEMTNYSLTISISVFAGIEGKFIYDENLFDESTIEKLARRFLNIAQYILTGPGKKIADIELISKEEKKQVLFDFNNTKTEYPKDKTIYRLFEEQVEKKPDAVGVVYEDRLLTYRMLRKKSDQLAGLLKKWGTGANSLVGIMTERSIEMMVGLLGIIKAGCAYLPIEPGYPLKRVKYILKDSEVQILITQRKFKEKLADTYGYTSDFISLEELDLFAGGLQNYETLSTPQDPVYVIYTSGSTGNPKGVMIEHRSLVNRIDWMQKKYPLNGNDTILQKTPFTFDVSVWELFWWAIEGAKLCFLIPGGEKNPEIIKDTIEKNVISIIHFVPSMLNEFLEYLKCFGNPGRLSGLKQIFVSGETLQLSQVKLFKEIVNNQCSINTKLANLYGPTEAAIDVSYFDCDGLSTENHEKVPIGKPINNINIYIVDKDHYLIPAGIPGELCIGGVGLARGYINRPELTTEKFVANPFEEGERIYKTGDIARWLANGQIEFFGRVDNQVKIRGYRIEPGEIESQLLKHEEIKEAVVTVTAKAGSNKDKDKYLCAYYVQNGQLKVSKLREYLLRELPDYMIPSFFVPLEKIPLTPNGKVDRRALPKPEFNAGKAYTAPRDEIEKKLVEIWSGVLGIEIDKISIDANFFEMGGHSLKATRFISRVYKLLQVNIPLSRVFQTPRIRDLSSYIKTLKKDKYFSIAPAEEKKYYALSSEQKRLYFIQHLNKNSVAYNSPLVVELEGNIEIIRFEEAFEKLLHRHESLRTSFEIINGKPGQRISGKCIFKIEYSELENTPVYEIIKRFVRPFDLSRAPLMRVGLIKKFNEKYLLIVDMHHIITDGISAGILMRELMVLYKGEELPDLKLKYRDYSEWQNREKEKENIKRQEAFWLKELEGEMPVFTLPTDYERGEIQGYEGERVYFSLDGELTGKLRELMKKEYTTLFMVLLAVYNILLSKYANHEDIIVGTGVAGRNHADLQDIIGMFVSMLPLRNRPVENKGFREFLKEVKENTVKAFENQDYQFNELVKRLGLHGQLNRNPVFDTVFQLQNLEFQARDGNRENKDLNIIPCEVDYKLSHFDLSLEAEELDNRINMSFTYSTALFKKSTIEKMKNWYIDILKQTISNWDMKLEDIKVSYDLKDITTTALQEDPDDFAF
ncbi:MAG: amino acid adenylation domain-containing protein [Candidatus Aminicenantes bacterium]|nr:amino acid adenylation domain-containing protein [Candidatus Aminicenantes bacterium]NIN21805.1 amino acid adenylation domain-containing protein [Candidatus Aminicenantes bacterium]NIN45597.1 amino acid adenylation domain-containing protein [Candidatus Aminicenantes bacterium]NIN88428.1 amino acid adenylation domain-containing protein [Candidatus Aminicenantes bacterium]NIR09318.1 amino acid adenylation domain-containing protein [Candidatus Aminicenantes bacterium]